MTAVIDRGTAGAVHAGGHAGVLAAIHRPGVALALWRRRVDPLMTAWLDRLPTAALPHGRMLIAPEETAAAVGPLMAGDEGGRRLFLRDVARLVQRFATVAETDLVDLRLDRIDNDACRRFHVDKVRLRLLCTYRGPGTQWVLPAARAAALARPESYAGAVRELPRFAVGLCRGDHGGDGLVHRSPPLAGSGITRLLLCLNRPSVASPERWR